MCRHLTQLGLQILHKLVGLRRPRTVAYGGSSAGTYTTGVQGRGTAAGGSERRDGGGRVCWSAAPSGDRIIALAAVIGVPEALDPLKELEVVPVDSNVRGAHDEEGSRDVLHLALHKPLHRNGLPGRVRYCWLDQNTPAGNAKYLV